MEEMHEPDTTHLNRISPSPLSSFASASFSSQTVSFTSIIRLHLELLFPNGI